MATAPETIDALLATLGSNPDLSYRKMFGEYALYCDGKVEGLVCDDQIFVKPTAAGRELLKEVIEEPAYPGAKPYFLIPEDDWDGEYLERLIRVTADELPMPKPKKGKAR